MIIRLPIDIKSLHYNIFNDNRNGHTATVATPIKQGSSVRSELMSIFKIPQNERCINCPEFMSELVKTARQTVRITGIFTFDKIAVNGELINTEKSFCIYTREEIDSSKVHFGRVKMHYPTNLHYFNSEIDIDNRTVIKAVSEAVFNYAFFVNAFEYDSETGILNFCLTIVGENKIPYSKVFINERGVGSKFVSMSDEYVDVYDSEIISLRQKFGETVGPDNFIEIMRRNKEIATECAVNFINNKGAEQINELIKEYPYSLYDIEYRLNGKMAYLIVCFTSTTVNYFNLSAKKIRFLNDFQGKASLVCISDINGNPIVTEYYAADINAMRKIINSVMFREGGYNE